MDLQSNLVTITPAPDRLFRLADVPRTVQETGFQPGGMRLRAEGRFVQNGQAFQILGWPDSLPVDGSEPPVPEGQVLVEAAIHLAGESAHLLHVVEVRGGPDRSPGI